jgi:hypothetical protein
MRGGYSGAVDGRNGGIGGAPSDAGGDVFGGLIGKSPGYDELFAVSYWHNWIRGRNCE